MLSILQCNVLEKVPKQVKNPQYYLQRKIVDLKTEIKQIEKRKKFCVFNKNSTFKKEFKQKTKLLPDSDSIIIPSKFKNEESPQVLKQVQAREKLDIKNNVSSSLISDSILDNFQHYKSQHNNKESQDIIGSQLHGEE